VKINELCFLILKADVFETGGIFPSKRKPDPGNSAETRGFSGVTS